MKRCIIWARVIMAAANCSPAVASRSAKYIDDLWVLTPLGAQPLDAQLLSFFNPGAAQVVERGAQAVARGGARFASRTLGRGA
jgi:hypothetical protein